jgi:hypothetical protein
VAGAKAAAEPMKVINRANFMVNDYLNFDDVKYCLRWVRRDGDDLIL